MQKIEKENYKKIKQIGEGSFGKVILRIKQVYLAKMPSNDKLFAIK